MFIAGETSFAPKSILGGCIMSAKILISPVPVASVLA